MLPRLGRYPLAHLPAISAPNPAFPVHPHELLPLLDWQRPSKARQLTDLARRHDMIHLRGKSRWQVQRQAQRQGPEHLPSHKR